MKCPSCNSSKTSVRSTHWSDGLEAVRRRRRCEECGYRWGTVEVDEDQSGIIPKKRPPRQSRSPRRAN
jgi:transcriptional repressor NrdR